MKGETRDDIAWRFDRAFVELITRCKLAWLDNTRRGNSRYPGGFLFAIPSHPPLFKIEGGKRYLGSVGGSDRETYRPLLEVDGARRQTVPLESDDRSFQ